MSDASDDASGEDAHESDPGETGETGGHDEAAAGGDESTGDEDLEALRQQVDEEYDFEDFGPNEMSEMSPREWEAAFDPDTWITGEQLLDRVEADLKSRVASREVFARVERFDDLLVAYSDSGYAAVYSDGSVEGRGTVLRDVKPTVALCSMESYDVPEAPESAVLPEPQEVPESSDALGNTVLQVVAGVQVLAGLVMLGAWILYGSNILSAPGGASEGLNLALLVVAGLGFLIIGILLFVMVANARLSDKFRAEEFRNRLRAIGLEEGERPEFLDEIEGIEGQLPDRESDPGEGESEGSPGEASRGQTSETE
jgi:hypothetical protein